MAERATKKTPEVIERILNGLIDGVALRKLCREEGMPNWRTVYDWIDEDPDLAARIARARDLGMDAIAEDILDTADNTPPIAEHIQRSRMLIDTRLKLLAKWHPNKYGDKRQHEFANKEGETLKVEATPSPETVALTLKLTKALRANGDDQ